MAFAQVPEHLGYVRTVPVHDEPDPVVGYLSLTVACCQSHQFIVGKRIHFFPIYGLEPMDYIFGQDIDERQGQDNPVRLCLFCQPGIPEIGFFPSLKNLVDSASCFLCGT